MKKFMVGIAIVMAIMSVMAFGPCETAVAAEATDQVAAEELTVKEKVQAVNDWACAEAEAAGIEVKWSHILVTPLGNQAVWTIVAVENGETEWMYHTFDVEELMTIYDYIQMKTAVDQIMANL